MKQEKLFEALADVGDDLVQMAQEKRYVNHWKRWGRTAACLALVICLTVLALPYLPVGCGAKEEAAKTEAPAEAPAETPAEAAPAPPAERPAAEEAPAESAKEESRNEGASGGYTTDEMPPEKLQEAITVWLDGQAYELLRGVVEQPVDLGEELGAVERSDGRNLKGCRVFAVVESEYVYVEVPEGYLRGIPVQ